MAKKKRNKPNSDKEVARLTDLLLTFDRMKETVLSKERALPISVNSKYECSKCGAGAYYDGRCGDGPVLTCKCNSVDDYRGTNK